MCRSEYVYFKSTKFIKIYYFYIAHNTKNFVMTYCMLARYVIDYVQIYFHNFLELQNIISIFKKLKRALELGR
jgi:hypothetical protein